MGYNHRSADLEQRSSMHQNDIHVEWLYEGFPEISSIVELSTCNRKEIYGMINEDHLEHLFDEAFGIEKGQYCFLFKGEEAIEHIFNVATGLDSQVVGDNDILGQFKKAFAIAKKKDRLNGYMERMANTCIQAAKDIRNNTDLTKGTTSLSYAAIQLMKDAKIDSSKKILIVGLGKFGSRIAKNIQSHFPDNELFLCNRTDLKSFALQQRIDARVILFEELKDRVDEFDVLISAISDPGFRIELDDFISPKKRLFIDLSVPTFFSNELKNIDHHSLFQLNDAAEIVNESLEQRSSSIPLAEAITAGYIKEFKNWSSFRLKSDSIHKWKERVANDVDRCPHINALTLEEKDSLLNKSVRRFVNYVKNDHHPSDVSDDIISNFLKKGVQAGCPHLIDLQSEIKPVDCSLCVNC